MSTQLNKYPVLAVEITSFLANARDCFRKSSTFKQHDSKAILRFSHEVLIKALVWVRQAERTFRQSPPQGDSRDRDKEVATTYTMFVNLLEFIRDKCGAGVTD